MIRHPDVKSLLIESMTELMNKKPIQDISVKEVAENCRVSTRSFYNHFKDKYDLINTIYMGKEKELYSVGFGYSSVSRDSFISLFTYVAENQRFYDNACSYTGQNNLLESIREQGYVRMMECIRAKNGTEDVDERLCFAADMWLRGMKDTVRIWVGEGCSLSPQELTDRILYATPECLLAYIPH